MRDVFQCFAHTLYSSDVQQHAGGQAYERGEEQERVQDEHVGVAHGSGRRRIAFMQMRYVRGRLPAGTPPLGLPDRRRRRQRRRRTPECDRRGCRRQRGRRGAVGAWVVDCGHRGAAAARTGDVDRAAARSVVEIVFAGQQPRGQTLVGHPLALLRVVRRIFHFVSIRQLLRRTIVVRSRFINGYVIR